MAETDVFSSFAEGTITMFLVGENHKPMNIHTDLVAALSKELKALVDGKFRETTSKEVFWEDVDEESFARFAQYVYTGNYMPPRPGRLGSEAEKRVKDSEAARESTLIEEKFAMFSNDDDIATTRWNTGSQTSGKDKRKRRDYYGKFEHQEYGVQEIPLTSVFKDLQYVKSPPGRVQEKWKAHLNIQNGDDLTPMLLGHAKLYVLGDKWNIPDLKDLILQKLHDILKSLKGHGHQVPAIIDLLKYVYANTVSGHTRDRLRELVIKYIVYEHTSILDSKAYLVLAEKCASLACDILAVYRQKDGLHRTEDGQQQCYDYEKSNWS